jgi:Flp pilus assembly protein TadD
MTKPNRLATALTAASLVAIVTACAGPGTKPRSASIFGGKVDTSNIGLATRAQAALASNDISSAISLAERAVENTPTDAGFRALLGNCYLAAGRFASAEAAYRDSLSLVPTQGNVVLKLALVQIGQGRADEATLRLAEARGLVDPSDAGLALALAGDPQAAITLLEPAARAVGAEGRTRQNLALAYALAGDWEQARTIAAQDVPADQLDSRIQQWMALAKPGRASDQLASFIGIQPVAGDPGQPIRLALHKDEAIREAAAAPVAQPAPVEQAAQSVTVELPPATPATPQAEAVVLAAAEPVAPPSPYVAPEPVQQAEAIPAAAISEARPALSPAAVRLSESVSTLRKAAAPRPVAGKRGAVVQIGAYSSRDRIAAAWTKASGKHAALKRYAPVTARFAGAQGTVYRLSVKGFANEREAINLCASLKRAGRDCFVRNVSGDAPVQLASR